MSPCSPVESIEASVYAVRSSIRAACARTGRDPSGVLLVAASKSVELERIRRARDAGIQDFGENRAAELAAKAAHVEARWHFLGALQSGNAARIADHAEVIHSGVPGRALERIARRAAHQGKHIDCLLQVDFAGHRQGVAPEAVEEALGSIAELPGLRLVGLTTLPPLVPEPERGRPYFVRLRELRDHHRAEHPDLADLSMGMSADYEVAVEEGATMVRIGTALFGARPEDGRENRPA